jgi:hypothetical protein
MNRVEEPYFNTPNNDLFPSSTTTTTNSTFTDMTSLSSPSSVVNMQTVLIILLLLLLLIIISGLNIFNILGSFFQNLANFFGPVITQFLNALGYSAGTALDKVSDVSADVAKGGIDLVDGALNNVGGLLKGDNKTMPTPTTTYIPTLTPTPTITDMPTPPPNTPTEPPTEPEPDSSENNIQKPISADKWNWCLVGEYQNKRGCVEITDSDKCMSGQVFPSQKMCLNPTFTQN